MALIRLVSVGRFPGQKKLTEYADRLIYRKPRNCFKQGRSTVLLWEECMVTPDEVIETLENEYGEKISRRTLLRWEKAGCIPKPERGSWGQGGGKWTNYPDETIAEILAMQILRKRGSISLKRISEVREKGLEICGTEREKQVVIDLMLDADEFSFMVHNWLTTRAKILQGFALEQPTFIDVSDFWVTGKNGEKMRKIKLK